MTQIDSRIPMGVQQLDAGAAVGRGYQLRDLAAQADGRKLDTQIKQQALKKQGTLADLHRLHTQNGNLDRPAFTQGLSDAGYGADAAGMRKEWGDADKAEAEAMFKTGEHKMKVLDYTGKAIAGLLSNPNATANDVAREISGLVTAGLMSQEDGARTVREIPNDPGQRRQYLMQKGAQTLQAKDMFGMFMQRMEAVNLGGTTQFVDKNPITNPGIVGQQLQRTVTPEAQLSAGTARRGQDLTDSRARDFNATKVEENQLKREVKTEAANLTRASQLASFDTMLGTLDRLSAHPGLSRSVGFTGAFPSMPGSDSATFQAELNTFQSQAFLPMVAQLKGMGALSDAEGKKLTAAVGALDPKMGEQAFRDSIGRITADMQAARQRMAAGAGQQGAAPAAQQPAGQIMAVKDAADYARVPSGATYTTPDGKVRRKP